MNMLIRKFLLIPLCALSLLSISACSSKTKTETTVVAENPHASYRGEDPVSTTTTTTTEETSDGCGGVLSCTVDTVGSIIALPFKAVGALISGIF